MKTSRELRKFKRRMMRNPTNSERAFAEILTEFGIRYKTQIILGFYILDFIIPSKMLVIEIDGSSHNKKQEYDKKRDNFIKASGFSVLHIKNEDVEDTDISTLINCYPDIEVKIFRSALARGGVLKKDLIGRKRYKKKTKIKRERKPKTSDYNKVETIANLAKDLKNWKGRKGRMIELSTLQ